MQRVLHVAYIGVGSNIGDRIQNCRKAVVALGDCHGCHIHAQSPLYETEPVGMEDQQWFVNGVACVHTSLEPEALFQQLKAIEAAMGRRSGGARFGPRIMDMDILFFDALVLHLPQLTIPHPRAHERRFVLKPLCDLAPDLEHPVLHKSARYLLSSLNDGKRVKALL